VELPTGGMVTQSAVFTFEPVSFLSPPESESITWLHQSLPLIRPTYRPGLFPAITLKRFHAHGTVQWLDDGVHLQNYVPASSQAHTKLSPNVFLALVFDRHTPAMYNSLPGHEGNIVDFPILHLADVFDMSLYTTYGAFPQTSQFNPVPAEPGPLYAPVDPYRYEVLWSQALIPDQRPSATFDIISRLTVGEPVEIEEEFQWLTRRMYFSCTVDLNHCVQLQGAPAEGSDPGRFNPEAGSLFFVCFQSGGVVEHASVVRQTMSITAATHTMYRLNPQ